MKAFDFTQIDWYAQRAAAAYLPPDQIIQQYPNTIKVHNTRQDVQYFLEVDDQKQQQILVIRGTYNLPNAKEDADYFFAKDKKLGIYVHKGFDDDALLIHQEVTPLLKKDYTLILTGHSLGAAISSLLMIYFHEDGFRLGNSFNFGQPKFTNKQGVDKYGFLPLTRVVDENDVVPDVPPLDFVDGLHGGFEHLGDEIILLKDTYYVYRNQQQSTQDSRFSFWENVKHLSVSAHYMRHYLHNIESKFSHADLVPYDQRDQYYG